MRDEIIAGMKNAVARGQTLEQAAQSFINAGYNPQEVKAAYQMLSSGASNVIANANMPSGPGVQIQQNTRQAIGNYGNQRQPLQQNPNQAKQYPSQMQPQAAPIAPPGNPPEKKKGGNTALLITMIIVAALILLGSLGYLFYVLYMK
ncbi:hypothetical protein J4233_00870 [Candidatus Pacearchaeota archaeon]|nr:hypothetical protein [uncultured archaeon]AQS28827.1 hypothetical protein [uncultured archaeon]AQS29014.1 hypothetical protein [uncultured archaeon]AQS29643.1 hypothetical protein [uncultured archaeon]MBS3076802.1 hypothetical protein [Candidatus Pacearchaeota archaeon]